jgi:hypothetical protein
MTLRSGVRIGTLCCRVPERRDKSSYGREARRGPSSRRSIRAHSQDLRDCSLRGRVGGLFGRSLRGTNPRSSGPSARFHGPTSAHAHGPSTQLGHKRICAHGDGSGDLAPNYSGYIPPLRGSYTNLNRPVQASAQSSKDRWIRTRTPEGPHLK